MNLFNGKVLFAILAKEKQSTLQLQKLMDKRKTPSEDSSFQCGD